MKQALLLAALLALPRLAAAQTPPVAIANGVGSSAGTTLKEMLSGSAHPLTMKLRDMKPEEWRRFSLADQTDGGGAGNFLMLFYSVFAGANGANALSNTDAVYYTQAQTVAIGAEIYLVAYRPLLKQPDMTALMMQGQNIGNGQPRPEQIIPEKLTLDSNVSLSLLNVKKISGMADIRAFDAAQEVAERQASDKALLDMIQANAAQNNPAVNAPLPEVIAPKIRTFISADKTLAAKENSIVVEEGENSITLSGYVTSAKVKEYAGHVVRKYFKDNGLGFNLNNQLTAPDEKKTAPTKTPQSQGETGAPRSKPAKKKS